MEKPDKNTMRKDFLARRRGISKEQRAEKSRAIMEKILELDLYKNADWLFCYIDMGSEVITTDLIKRAWKDGKRVAVPIALKDRYMYFVEISTFDNMSRSDIGVMEPDIASDRQVYPDNSSLMIVPGSMFDINKNRSGYGGGYYDTYTEKYNVNNTVGVCYDIQLVKEIPVEPFDRKLKMVIPEKRTIE